MRELVNQWNCSPKLKNSGNEFNIRYKPEVLKVFNELNTQFKFVIETERDYAEILEHFDFLYHGKIWLMPAGENQELLSKTKPVVAELAKKYHHKLTNRLHIEIWDKKTGV